MRTEEKKVRIEEYLHNLATCKDHDVEFLNGATHGYIMGWGSDFTISNEDVCEYTKRRGEIYKKRKEGVI
ncbi:hypothetical protein D3C80_435330 [compost metagenome]